MSKIKTITAAEIAVKIEKVGPQKVRALVKDEKTEVLTMKEEIKFTSVMEEPFKLKGTDEYKNKISVLNKATIFAVI